MKRLFAVSILLLLVLSVFVFPLDSLGSSVFYVSLAFFVCALFAASWKGGMKEGIGYLGLAFRLEDAPKLILQSVVLFFACAATTVALSGIFLALGVLDTGKVQAVMVQLPLPVLIIAFTFSPLAEEAFFRGFLFGKIGEWLGKMMHGWMPHALAAIASSAVFALLHVSYGSVAEIGVAFAISIILCIGTFRFKSLWPAVLAHAAFNFASIVMAVFT